MALLFIPLPALAGASSGRPRSARVSDAAAATTVRSGDQLCTVLRRFGDLSAGSSRRNRRPARRIPYPPPSERSGGSSSWHSRLLSPCSASKREISARAGHDDITGCGHGCRVLVILSRHNRAMYWLLQRQIGRTVEVIIDRREGERRRAARAVPIDRRRGDRRVNRLDHWLRQFGWVVVGAEVAPPLPGAVGTSMPMPLEEPCTACGRAILPGHGRYRLPHGAAHTECFEATRGARY
jgi:hypothetical protein